MYSETKTWNPFVGCHHNCIYCKPSFQAQLKRWAKKNCQKCYNFIPHLQPERLNKIPSAKIIFVCGDGDIAFCPEDYVFNIIEKIKEHNRRCPHKTYYFQSKRPECFEPFLEEFPENVILLTTLETNRDEGYEKISKAPKPSERFKQFLKLDYPRKVVTVEPVMDFDLEVFVDWIEQINPEYVWFGFNSRPKQVKLPEPSPEKARKFVDRLKSLDIEVREKKRKEVS